MSHELIARIEALAASANTEAERWLHRAQLACVLARLGHIVSAREEIAALRGRNAAYDPRLTAWIFLAEGLSHHYESLSTEAADRFKRAYGVGLAIDDNEIRSLAAAWLAASEFLMASYETSAMHAVEAIRSAPQSASLAISRAHLVLANCLCLVEDSVHAAKHYKDARSFAIEARDISMQSSILYNVAAFRIARLSLIDAFGESIDSELPLASLELDSISNLDSGLGIDSLRAMVPLLRAQLHLIKKRWVDANALYVRSISEAANHGQLRETPRFLAEQAHCLAMMGENDKALAAAAMARERVTGRTDLDDLAACYARLALCFDALGDTKSAAAERVAANENRARYVTFQANLRAKVRALLDDAAIQ